MRAPYRQEQGCGKADAQRNEQEPEAVRLIFNSLVADLTISD